MAPRRLRKKFVNADESSSKPESTEKGTENSSKPESETTDKSVPQNSKQGKDGGTSQLVQDRNKKKLKKTIKVKDGGTGQQVQDRNKNKMQNSTNVKDTSTSQLVQDGNKNKMQNATEVKDVQDRDKNKMNNSTEVKDVGTSQQVQDGNKNKMQNPTEVTDAGTSEQARDKSKINMQDSTEVQDAGTSQQVQDRNKNKRKSPMQNKDAGTSKQVQDINKKRRKRRKERGNETKDGQNNAEKNQISRHTNKGKNILSEKREVMDKRDHNGRKEPGGVKRDHDGRRKVGGGKRDHNGRKELGGMIFMCNAKTKRDCFHYQIMGVTANKKEFVMSIRPGLKLFLYDFDLKLMYGIYNAASAGGMRLEPAAFGGAFPVQVRFAVERDCLPLPEDVFKKAIRDNYDERTHKFGTELTFEQVNRLTELFQPVPRLQSNVRSSVQEPLLLLPTRPPHGVTLPNEDISRERVHRDDYSRGETRRRVEHSGSRNEAPSRSPLFLSEKEYRSYGLPQSRHMPTLSAAGYDYRSDLVREQLQRNPTSVNGNGAQLHREAVHPNPLFRSEAEYRTYGIGRGQELPTIAPTAEINRPLQDRSDQICNPYDDSTASLVNRYLQMPRIIGIDEGSRSLGERETHRNDFNNYIHEGRGQPERVTVEQGRVYTPYDSRAPPDYNRRFHHLGGQPSTAPATVSSRYAFASPSVTRR